MTPQFKSAVTKFGPRFMQDLGLTALQTAGIFGNYAVESNQFRALQEYNPTVKGSRGGWGWAQWTGPRRRAFEAWADAQGYKRDDAEAFYQYTLTELRGSEAGALTALRRTKTLDTATTAFMKKYERPGVPHEDRRKAFALEALNVLIEAGAPHTVPARPSPAPAPVLRDAPSAAPEARQVPLPPKIVAAPWWSRLWPGRASAAAPVDPRPGLAVNGDPALWDIQSKLKRFGYEPILVDGLNGPRTRAQVRAVRERMGLPPGDHIDTTFTASLAGLLPAEVAEVRVTATNKEIVKHQAPDLFAPLKGIQGAGILTTVLGGLGAASDAGLMDSIKQTADSVTTTAGSIQEGLAVLFNVGRWAYAHWWIFALGGGLYLIAKAVIGTLKLIALWRQARAS